MLVTHRIEVKRLTTDLVDSLTALGSYASLPRNPDVIPPDEISVPHPNRPGEEVTLHHIGGAKYSPVDPIEVLTGVEEVEGKM